ncbi:UvrB/UvrC motif-containing protein [Virgibacillus xinjiangensis]|uniref:UvrB/UvrC motif-containing protein n=1 Tax=Virgibacillus xinjiangensis TaxID=393090 RepID=A0ABV7CX71_9BACI
MECQECHKRPATLHLTKVINGSKTTVHVCGVCAKEMGYMNSSEEGYSLQNLLSGLFNFDPGVLGAQKGQPYQQSQEFQCPGCGMTFSEFQRVGKFGCASCYKTFSSRLDPIFRRVHSGNTQHSGKIPKRQGGDLNKKKQLENYREQLKHLIEEEAFEEAAKVRDQIRALQSDKDDREAGEGN